QLKVVQVGDLALGGDDLAREAIPLTEVRVSCRDHAADEPAVLRIIEELDDLFGNGPLGGAVAVRRGDENERLGHLEVVVGGPERDPQCGPLEAVDEPAGVLRNGGKVDDVSHGPPHSARDTARAGASAWPFRAKR